MEMSRESVATSESEGSSMKNSDTDLLQVGSVPDEHKQDVRYSDPSSNRLE